MHLPTTTLASLRSDAQLLRRWEIWAAAAPLFEQHGYRGVTVDQLAHAAAMSPAGLYHYFPNKAAIALFPIANSNGLCRAWTARVAGLPADPQVRLNAMIGFAVEHAEAWRLALTLASQMTGSPSVERYAGRLLKESRRDFAVIARSVDPTLSDRRIGDLYEGFTAIVVTTFPGFDRSPEALRRRLEDAVRGWLSAATPSATKRPVTRAMAPSPLLAAAV